MKNIFFVGVLVFCSTLLNAQDRFFLYGKVLGADGTPIPSALVSFSTVIGRQPAGSAEAAPDGSFRLVISGPELTMLKFAAPLHDSLTLPLLLTTMQRTMGVTVRLAAHTLLDSNAAVPNPYTPIVFKDENTELGIAERLLKAFIEEKRLDSLGYIFSIGSPLERRDPDSLLAYLSGRIRTEENPMHREIFLLRYLQVRTNARRAGDPAIVGMVLNYVDPDSPFWSLAPELLTSSSRISTDFAAYVKRVRAQTKDSELKTWIDLQR